MDCSAFRKKHTTYVDDALTGELADAMEMHIRSCESCAAHDARIRRALFLVRNIPRLEPTGDFRERLFNRIESEQASWKSDHRPPGLSVRAFAASAVSLIAIIAIAAAGAEWRRRVEQLPRLPAVVALPPSTPGSASAPAMVAAMSAGMAVWPALWLAEEAPFRYASDASRPASNATTQP